MSLLTRCRVVLVRTHFPGNLGAAARAMRNFGLSDLVLVAPYTSTTHEEARRLATHGGPVLDAARVVPTLADAVADCVHVLATAGLADGTSRKTVVGPPDALLPPLLDAAAGGPVALVFGPEPHGLTNDEVARCHGLIHVPVDPDCTSLNLAQAVAVCLYELRKQWSARTRVDLRRPIAPHADQERVFEHLRDALTAAGYLYGTKAGPLMDAVRHLIGRASPSPQEVRMLHGLARQLLWLAKHPPGDDPTNPGERGASAP